MIAKLEGFEGATSRIAGGGAEVAIAGSNYRGAQGLDPELIAEIERLYGFDKPAPERFGFLSTFRKEEVRKVVEEFVAGEYTLVDRSLVQLSSDAEIPEFEVLNFALNEITVSRKDTTSMITVETFLDDEYLTSYWADGLIVATPTGSTGYSLSCGGPVITPTARSLIITPIAPHNLNARPLVISDDTIIRLRVSGREENHLVSLDSRIATIANGTEITISRANFTVKMIEYASESFLKTIRNKLLWGQDRRN
jgi:NAD+ kinase